MPMNRRQVLSDAGNVTSLRRGAQRHTRQWPLQRKPLTPPAQLSIRPPATPLSLPLILAISYPLRKVSAQSFRIWKSSLLPMMTTPLKGTPDCQTGVVAWDLSSRKVKWTMPLSGKFGNIKIDFSPDGKQVAIADQPVHLLDANNGASISKRSIMCRKTANIEALPSSIAYSKDGRLAVGLAFGQVIEFAGPGDGTGTYLAGRLLGDGDNSSDHISILSSYIFRWILLFKLSWLSPQLHIIWRSRQRISFFVRLFNCCLESEILPLIKLSAFSQYLLITFKDLTSYNLGSKLSFVAAQRIY